MSWPTTRVKNGQVTVAADGGNIQSSGCASHVQSRQGLSFYAHGGDGVP